MNELLAEQSSLCAVEGIELFDPDLQLLVRNLCEQVPVDTPFDTPLGRLPDFAPHKQELGTRMRKHIAVEQAHIGHALPWVAGHTIDQRALAVNHLIMRERQHEIFGKSVHNAECDCIVVVFSIDRIIFKIIERIMHPAHHPFLAKTQPSGIYRSGDATPGS